MKEKLLLFIVLFIVGEMTKAQELLLTGKSSTLRSDYSQSAVSMQKAEEEDEGESYWVAAMAHFDDSNNVDASSLSVRNYKANIKIEGTEATISGLVSLSTVSESECTQNAVKGTYDAEAKTITLNTEPYNPATPLSDYTKIGSMKYLGGDVTLVLFSGYFQYDDTEGGYVLVTEDKLVFDVSDDLSTLTPRTGFGVYGFYTLSGNGVGFVEFYKSADLFKTTAEAKFIARPKEIEFAGDDVVVGGKTNQFVYLSNIGLTATNYTVNVIGEGLKVYATKQIKAETAQKINVIFTPKTEGEYNGSIEFVAENGSAAKINIKGYVKGEALSFEDIMREGSEAIVFEGPSKAEYYSYMVTDTITGFPVAVSRVEDLSTGTCEMICRLNIPVGKTGVFSWKGLSLTKQPNGTIIYIDGMPYYNETYVSPGENNWKDFSDMVCFEEGEHTVSFKYNIGNNWYLKGFSDTKYKNYIYDLYLKYLDNTDYAAILKEESKDFGTHYVDKYEIPYKETVNLINCGIKKLKVTGFVADGPFDGILSEEEVYPTEILPVTIVFKAKEPGTYTGKLTIQTTAGDFTVDCQATSETIVKDYSPMVSTGEFSFDTSIEHPFNINAETGRATSSIGGTDMSLIYEVNCWLDAYFIVPEGDKGILSWDAYNSSGDYFELQESKAHNDGTIITIDEKIWKDYAGEMDASSSTFKKEILTFNPGLHKIRFLYRKIYNEPSGKDMLWIENLALNLETSGIQSAKAGREVSKVEIFSVSGEKLCKPVKGINIIRETYTDGTTETRKVKL